MHRTGRGRARGGAGVWCSGRGAVLVSVGADAGGSRRRERQAGHERDGDDEPGQTAGEGQHDTTLPQIAEGSSGVGVTGYRAATAVARASTTLVTAVSGRSGKSGSDSSSAQIRSVSGQTAGSSVASAGWRGIGTGK